MCYAAIQMVLQSSVLFASQTGWLAGLGIGFTIVAVVVVLVALILMYAARINDQAQDGINRMDQARGSTLPVWEIQHVNTSVTRIWKAAEAARGVLEARLR